MVVAQVAGQVRRFWHARRVRAMAPERGRAPPSELGAWRFDIGEDAYALLVLPRSPPAEVFRTRLTAAEQGVAGLVAAGLSNAEIARRRGVSPRTVANQAASIFRKFGVRSRLGLHALLARKRSCGEENVA